MPCDCQNNTNNISYIPNSGNCTSCSTICSTDTSTIKYSGANLPCINQVSGTTLETILLALDTKICSIAGTNFSGFNTHCITNPDSSQITTQQQFVEAITTYLCNFKTTYNTFITGYNTFVTNTTTSINNANIPGITSCLGVGIISTDTNAQAFTKSANAICAIQAAINPSTANWNSCSFSVGTAPTTILGGFNKVLDYICQVKNLIPTSGSSTLPIFNNVGSCLPGTLTTADTLVDTITKIKSKLCSISSDGYNLLNYGCVDGATNALDALQNTINRVNQYSIYTFDSTYFSLSNINSTYPCLGKNVTLNPSGLDKKVASNSADTTPGTLFDKLQAGTNISLDYTTTPGKVIIATPVSTGDHKIIVNSSDTTPDYLDIKIDGVADTTGAITIAASANTANSKVIVTPSYDSVILFTNLLNALPTNSTLNSLFCSKVCSCNCGSKSSVQITTTTTTDRVYGLSVTQNTPSISWYNSGNTSLPAGSTVNTGSYPLTATASNPQVTISLSNNGSTGGSFTAHIYVTDPTGTIVTGSTNITQVVALGGTFVNSTFSLGTSTTAYIIHVDLS